MVVRTLKILVVDDSEATRGLLQDLLMELGFMQVLTANSAEEAFEALKAKKGKQIGVILMDISMPGIDGIEACRRIKTDLGFPDVQIFMVTGFSDTEHVADAIGAGADGYIAKPFDELELQSKVRLALKEFIQRTKTHSGG